MGLPTGTKLPPSAQGQVGVDGDGNYVLIDKRKGTVKPVTQPDSTAPVTSMQGANATERKREFGIAEQGRNTRAAASQAGATERAGMRQGAGGAPRKLSGTEINKRTDLIGAIEDSRQKMFEADKVLNDPKATEESKASKRAVRARAQREGRLAAAQLNSMNAGYEAGPGTDFPYYKPVEQQAAPAQSAPALKGRTISQQNFEKYKKDHGNVAAQALLDDGVTIRK
jgi:hypothetical protein